MNIATALNKKYIPYTTVMLTSICINSTEHIDAYLLNSELENDDIMKMMSSLEKYDINLISVNVDKGKLNERMPRNDQWSLEMYYRLFMFELLPKTVDRVLYLDGDIIVNNDINEFYYMSFDDAEMIVCDDKGGLNKPETYGDKHREMFSEAYKHGFRYFNSGVILFNMNKMRSLYTFDLYLEAMDKWNYKMEAPDQDILNYVHWKKVKYADYKKYDMFARVAHNQKMTYGDIMETASIIHYPGYKPWEAGSFHFDIEMIWWEYAKETPYYVQLLENFVTDVLNDNNVSNYIKMLEKDLNIKKKVLSKALRIMELGSDTNVSDDNYNSEDEVVSIFDSPTWQGGYSYSFEQKQFWVDARHKENYVKLMEQFLEEIMTDSRAENYAVSLNASLKELDKALDMFIS
ncbi:Lipopolysaccharide biosynthesis protein, LPS:glycosyltransferase [Butyrivibrio sp. INlla18]|uniref:glycosyltransferase family 8 protein n=1 Tax=Butyrivibrio sp. INlla18 TaxID=1520806 RepID=UPI0008873D82|nr:glycosyltransferase family 8 protein [Butyrivibrio sp. INlla18]SDA41896.1 Lipopolysaccharide biosynthesis protein, LPS:glycosyltransferase [Butyrivibrio sp. INlla18]